ncbi:MAG: hypothetical protein DRJ65_20905 [Acidobacteria bacterium]|nr:MAG: hypothetical protein DRJ65_20905 [Acidobacteriota bacterium]
MTSAACGVSQHSIADRAAVGCPVSPFFASTAQLRVLPDEESRTRHVPSEKALLDFGLVVSVRFRGENRFQHR